MEYAEIMRIRRQIGDDVRSTDILQIAQNEMDVLKELIQEKAIEIAETYLPADNPEDSPEALELKENAREGLIDAICRELRNNA